MSDVYFEAMEFHSLEARERELSHRDGYNKWVEETTATFDYIQQLIDKKMPLGEEEVMFLFRHAAENVYQKAVTAEHHFFAHHFDRVREDRKTRQEESRKNKVIDDYSRTLKEIASTHVPVFGSRQVLESVKKSAYDSVARCQSYS